VLDLLLAAPALLVLAPVIALVALAVRWRMGPGVLFCQERPGHNGKPFMLYKFRTMLNTRDSANQLLPDAERLPPFGVFLRSSSLDELPQLWNVVRGDMSLIGPRPLMMRYLGRYTPQQFRRHDMLPGISGWAQVNGRNDVSWERKFELDVWYIDHVSFLLDAKIIWLTLLKLVTRQGVSAAGHATAPDFEGLAACQDRQVGAEGLPANASRDSSS
jgi:sugar transferase EpsL